MTVAKFELPGSELCVHCGFCLQACPTYLSIEDENDSPRGRIVLMKAMARGELAMDDPETLRHIDQCLGCRGCETACPSGVPYGQLLETTRAALVSARPLPLVARVMLFVFASPALTRVAMAAARALRSTGLPRMLARLPGSAGFAMAMLASTERTAVERARRYPAVAHGATGSADRRMETPAPAGSGRRLALLRGCVMDGLFSGVHDATERTLTVNGYEMIPAPAQRCCGALHAHAGDAVVARELARANIAAFEACGADHIVVNSAGCGAMMRSWAHLLHDEPAWSRRAEAMSARVRDVTELLAGAGPVRGGAVIARAAYDAPCHLLHGQRISAEPLAVLGAIPGLELVPLEGADQCCGSAGIFNLIEPEVSARVLAPKLANIRLTGASVVATGNPGCLMQIGAGLIQESATRKAEPGQPTPLVRHPVELLDEAYAQL